MRTTSLSRQLIGGVLLAEFLCAALLSAVAIGHEMHGRRRAFDVMLRGRADSLLGAVQDAEDPDDNVTVDPTELVLPREDVYEVLSPAGRALGHSPASSDELVAALVSTSRSGYFNFTVAQHTYRGVRYTGMRVIDRAETGGLRRPVIVLYAAPTRDLLRQAAEAVRFYVLTGIVLLVGTGWGLVWFLRRRLLPLHELAAIAGGVSVRSWEFRPPQQVLHTAELAPIAQSITQLLKGLREAFERQRQLTGDATHELKTSIAVLKSSLQLLSMSHRTTAEYEAGMDGLLLDVQRMEELTGRMLALARLEEAPVESAEPLDLSEVVYRTVERLTPVARARGVRLQVGASKPTCVALQSDDAETLCSNLILNAVQHSPRDGMVSCTVTASERSWQLRVLDEGEGIPAEALPHVFDRFYRADRSRSRNSGGAGLGLSICKAIVERYGGTIAIQCLRSNGTEAIASLPQCAREDASLATMQAVQAQDEILR